MRSPLYALCAALLVCAVVSASHVDHLRRDRKVEVVVRRERQVLDCGDGKLHTVTVSKTSTRTRIKSSTRAQKATSTAKSTATKVAAKAQVAPTPAPTTSADVTFQTGTTAAINFVTGGASSLVLSAGGASLVALAILLSAL